MARLAVIAIAVFALAAVTLTPVVPAHAATIQVTATGDSESGGSLRAAILQANASVGIDDTINIPAGTYLIEIDGDAEQDGLTGDFDVRDSVTISGAGMDSTFIDAQQLERIFDVPLAGLDVTIRNLTVRNGFAADTGGGIRTLSNITMQNVRVLNNTLAGDFGGGMVVQQGHAELSNVIFDGNESNLTGGGIALYVSATIEVDGGTFINNVSGNSAGLNVPGDGILRNIVVRNNTADFSGGGIGTGGGQNTTVLIEDAVVDGNHAGNRGGGIEGAATSLSINRAAITNNTAGVTGGGMTTFAFGEAVLTNVTISGNSAGGDGGGIYNGNVFGGSATLRYSTIANNEADANTDGIGTGGGIYNVDNEDTEVTLYNSILANNSDHSGAANHDCWGQIRLDDINLVSETSADCELVSPGNDFIDVDPLLGPLANNGGNAGKTHALLEGSPARDVGTDCAILPFAPNAAPEGAGGAPDTDQRGFIRPQGITCDLGAFEGEAPLIWGDNDCSGDVDEQDALLILLNAAGLLVESSSDSCPDPATEIGGGLFWFDTNCSNDPAPGDIELILTYIAELNQAVGGECPNVGEPLLFG